MDEDPEQVREGLREMFEVISGAESKEEAKQRLAFWIQWRLDVRNGKKPS